MTPPSRLDALRRLNGSLRSAAEDLRADRKQCLAVRPQNLAGILELIGNASSSIPSVPGPEEPELAREIDAYRQNLETLRDLLPDLHARLLAEKARLEASLAHLSSAVAWVRASRKTL